MVSGKGTPETNSTSGAVESVDGKKQWVSPVVHIIDLESAEHTNAHTSPDSTKTSRL
jgi:hypothetical protein